MHARVALAASEVARTGALPIAIGGGHDLTCAFVRGVVTHARSLRPASPLAVLNFDAHLDVRETLGSGMPFRAINAEFAPVAMGIVGANVFANTHEHAAYFQSQARGSFLADAHALTLWLASLPKDCMLACSFDLDVLDASHAPGVSARNPAGLTVAVAADMLLLAAQDSRLVCVDFMELCPARDDPAWAGAGSEAGRTARAAAHLFLTVLHARSSKSRRVVDTE
jgi:formiminoglutamase